MADHQSQPLEIVGVDTERVGTPRNDGSRGSALYRVPIKLNRTPTSDEARLLIQAWDSPSQFSMMHRAGIATVSGDTIVLDGTTLEEVERYHARTLSLAVQAANAGAEALRQRRAEEAARAEQAQEEHRRHVQDVASRITFE